MVLCAYKICSISGDHCELGYFIIPPTFTLLKSLRLGSNKLKGNGIQIPETCNTLRILRLSENEIESFDDIHVTRLVKIHLENNKFTEIPVSFLKKQGRLEEWMCYPNNFLSDEYLSIVKSSGGCCDPQDWKKFKRKDLLCLDTHLQAHALKFRDKKRKGGSEESGGSKVSRVDAEKPEDAMEVDEEEGEDEKI